jgi:hypothetical protein
MMPPSDIADFVKRQLRAGEGCVSFENPWRRDVRQRAREEAEAVGKKK